MNLFLSFQKTQLEVLKVSFVNLCRAAVAPKFLFFFFLVKLESKDFYCLTRYAGMFSTEKSELEKEGNNCFAGEFYVSSLKEREVTWCHR